MNRRRRLGVNIVAYGSALVVAGFCLAVALDSWVRAGELVVGTAAFCIGILIVFTVSERTP